MNNNGIRDLNEETMASMSDGATPIMRGKEMSQAGETIKDPLGATTI